MSEPNRQDDVLEYADAIRAAADLPAGSEIVSLLRVLDQYLPRSEQVLRDGGRAARVRNAHTALIRALAAHHQTGGP